MARIFSTLLMLLVAGTCWATGTLSIERVQARLFYAHTGTLSQPIDSKFALWNTIIGEGDAQEPSDQTLIEVIIQGTPGSYVPKARVDLTVTNSDTGKLIVRKSSEVGVLSKLGKFHVAFWLAGTGCQPLAIKATLHGTTTSSLTKIPFACGD
jgi:hypothetical protein